MSAEVDNVTVVDEPRSTLQHKDDDLPSLETSDKLTAEDSGVVDSVQSIVEELAAGVGHVPRADHNDDDSRVTDVPNDTFTVEASIWASNANNVASDREPQAPLQLTGDSDNGNTIIIHHSEPPFEAENNSQSVAISEPAPTSIISPNQQPVALTEFFQEDANKVVDAVISDISKDEFPTTEVADTQTPPVNANTTVVEGPEGSGKDREPPLGISTGPESTMSDAVKLSINGIGSATDAVSALSPGMLIHEPDIQMNRPPEMLEEVVAPVIEAQDIHTIATELVEDTAEPSNRGTIQMELEDSLIDEPLVTTEPKVSTTCSIDIASEDTPISAETELACIEAQSPTDSPELQRILHPATESKPVTAMTVEPTRKVAEPDSAEETAPAAEATIAAADPAGMSDASPVELSAEFVASVAAERTTNEEPEVAIEAVDQPVSSTELDVDLSIPEVVSAPAGVAPESAIAPTQLEETAVIADMELEVPADTTIAVDAEAIAVNDSIAAEPVHVTASDPEPDATAETDLVTEADPEPATVAPEISVVVELESSGPEMENTVVETVPIDIEPPSSNPSFIMDPEVGFVLHDEEPQVSVNEETIALLSNESCLEFAEEPEPRDIVAFEEPHLDKTLSAEEVDLADPAREPISLEEIAIGKEPALVQLGMVVCAPTEEPAMVTDAAPVEETIPSEGLTSIELATTVKSTPSIEEATEAPEFVLKAPTILANEAEVPIVQEDLSCIEEVNDKRSPPSVESPNEAALATEGISIVEEQPSAIVEEPPVGVSVEEDVPDVKDPSMPTPIEEVTNVIEEPPIEEAITTSEPPAPMLAESIPVVEEFHVPTPVEEVTTVVEESPVPVPVEDVLMAEELTTPAEDATIIEELLASVEDVSVVEGPPAPASVEDTPILEEPLVLAGVEEATVEIASALGEGHNPTAMEDTPVLVEQLAVVEEATPATEELLALEEGPAITSHEPSIVNVPPTPVKAVCVPESAEAAPVSSAESTCATSSVGETLIVAGLAGCEAPAAEQSVFVEESTTAQSEALVFEGVAAEEFHATVELTEEPPVASEEAKYELEEPPRVEVPASSKEQLTGGPVTEESRRVPIVEDETTGETTNLVEESAFTSRVQISEVPTDAHTIQPEVHRFVEDSEPPSVLAETSSEIQDVAEQQELSSVPVLGDIERPKSPWTPSYSVTTQGPGVPVEEPADAHEGGDDRTSTHIQTPEIVVDEAAKIVLEIAADVAVADAAAQLTEDQALPSEVEEAHPKFPWTPSYSVIVQGNVDQNEELDGLEQLPTSATQFVEAEKVEEQSNSFTQEVLIAGDVSSPAEVIDGVHDVLLETSNDIMEHVVPDPAIEAEVSQHVPSEQVTTAVEEPPVVLSDSTVEEIEEEIEQGSFIVEDESMELGATEPTQERSRSPWTPSYSVTGLEPAIALGSQTNADKDEFVEQGSFIIEPTTTAGDSESKPELLTPVDDSVDERPRSPWTPSYSVTKQGPTEEAEELDKLEQLPGPVSIVSEPATDEEPIPPVLITETRASVDEHVTTEEAPTAQEDLQIFPILGASQKIFKKPSLSAVDELNAADVTESTTLRIDIPSSKEDNRKRLESTTSSRFFPGGWFSSSPKVPEEGRTSLDVAAGEFIHQSSVENTPTTALPSAVEEDREKKARWCTIM